jgi:hypothetical protein
MDMKDMMDMVEVKSHLVINVNFVTI